MGSVFLAEHLRMGRRDAIKVLSRSVADDEDARVRFTREARNASRLNHPNVCTVYDFGEIRDGLPFIAMEYVDGETLTRVLEREGPLPPERAVTIAVQVCDALEAAHRRDIVHRDLKPDNVMLTRDSAGEETVKVVDFGIAKAMRDEGGGQNVTRPGWVVGTPEYVSPEQLKGRDLDGRSDLYSLGIVLFRMLSGRLPFAGDTWQEIMTRRLSEEPEDLAEVAGERVPAALARVVRRALRREPGERHADADELRQELRGALRGTAGEGRAVPPTAAIPDDGGEVGSGPAGRGSSPGDDGGAGPAPGGDDRPDLPWKKLAWAGGATVALVGLFLAGTVLLDGGDDGPVPPPDSAVAGDTSGPEAAVAALSLSPPSASVPAGGTVELSASVTDARGRLLRRPVSWSSSDPGVAGVSADGRVSGHRSGTARIVAASEDVADTARIAVRDTATPGPPEPGGSGPSVAEAEDALNRQLDVLTFTDDPGPSRLAAVADTGRTLWASDRLPDQTRALAAYVVGNAMLVRGDTSAAGRWLGRAVELDPENPGFRTLLEQVGGAP